MALLSNCKLRFLMSMFVVLCAFWPGGVKAETSTFYSDDQDGRIYTNGSDWSDVVDNTSGTVENDLEHGFMIEGEIAGGSGWISYSFFPFDTSLIPDDSVINSAEFCVYVYPDSLLYEATNTADLLLVEDLSSEYSLLPTDIQYLGNSISDMMLISDFVGDTVERCFVINDLSVVNKSGYTQLAFFPNNALSTTTAPTDRSYSQGYFSESAYKPNLTIHYSNIVASEMQYVNDLTVVSGFSENSDGTYSQIYYHIPFFAWIVLAVPLFWLMSRFIIELIIRLRK